MKALLLILMLLIAGCSTGEVPISVDLEKQINELTFNSYRAGFSHCQNGQSFRESFCVSFQLIPEILAFAQDEYNLTC